MNDKSEPRRAASGNDEKSLLHLAHVGKRFGDVVAVHGVELDIQRGAFVAIIGPSGCGKSTTLRLLAGLETPTQGHIYRRGKDVTHSKPWDRGMPMVWQSLALFPFLDVLDNVAFGLKMAGMRRTERRDKAMRWLRRFGIENLAARDISALSGGQLQRVALARALITEPDVLLLDEPLSALDAHLVVRMQAELTRLQRELGITFVYVTHSQSEALAMGDQIVVMNEGTIQQKGVPRAVYERPSNRFVAEFVGANNLLPGQVDRAEGDYLWVRTELGVFESKAKGNEDYAVGDKVHLVLSADRVRLSKAANENATNYLLGRLISEQFVGAVLIVHLDVGRTEDIRAQLSRREWDQLEVDSSGCLAVSWQPEDCLVVGD